MKTSWFIGTIMLTNMILPADTPRFHIECERPSHIFHVGENAVFSVDAPQSTPVDIEFSSDGEAILQKFSMTAPGKIRFTLPHPGFLRVKANSGSGDTAEAGVAFDPDEIRPTLPEPEDFDLFWEKMQAMLNAVPENFTMTEHCELATDEYSFFSVQCDTINNKKAYGHLRLPKGNGTFPLLVYVEGYGRGQNLEVFQEHCRNVSKYCNAPVAALTISIHAFEAPPRDSDYIQQFNHFVSQCPGGNYWLEGLSETDMGKSFFTRAILGAKRLCKLVCALPNIDQSHIVCFGVSQGGGFALYLSALCPQIRAACCAVPAFGDCGGFLLGRHPTQSNINAFRQYYGKMRYFDTANFAGRIRIPVLMTAGFIDNICPPSSIYAIYNQLQGPRFFYGKILHGHTDDTDEYIRHIWSFTAKHLLGK